MTSLSLSLNPAPARVRPARLDAAKMLAAAGGKAPVDSRMYVCIHIYIYI